MIGTESTAANTPAAIRTRFTARGLSWWPVVLFLPARMLFSFFAQGLFTALFAALGSAQPWQQATPWWTVYLTIADILCLVTLAWLVRREGIALVDLIGVRGKLAFKQLAWIPVYLLVFIPALALASGITQLVYGPTLPPYLAMVKLPPIGGLYSILVWPLIWSVTEELVYLGYLLPRIEARTGKTWLAVLIVTFFWGMQHIANPFIADWVHIISRVLAAFAAVGGLTLLFAWRRRLVPIMGLHYLFNLSTGLIIGIPSLFGG